MPYHKLAWLRLHRPLTVSDYFGGLFIEFYGVFCVETNFGLFSKLAISTMRPNGQKQISRPKYGRRSSLFGGGKPRG